MVKGNTTGGGRETSTNSAQDIAVAKEMWGEE
jgi:hypothetical protein